LLKVTFKILLLLSVVSFFMIANGTTRAGEITTLPLNSSLTDISGAMIGGKTKKPLSIGVYDTSGSAIRTDSLAALQIQLTRDFCPYYMPRCVTLISNMNPKPAMRLYIVNRPLVSEGIPSNGYHWYDAHGPYGFVTVSNNCPLSICASHELMEMLSDPLGTGREICDGLKEGYLIENQWVVDFRMPPKYHETFCNSPAMAGVCH
jgi:hypothetical protein